MPEKDTYRRFEIHSKSLSLLSNRLILAAHILICQTTNGDACSCLVFTYNGGVCNYCRRPLNGPRRYSHYWRPPRPQHAPAAVNDFLRLCSVLSSVLCAAVGVRELTYPTDRTADLLRRQAVVGLLWLLGTAHGPPGRSVLFDTRTHTHTHTLVLMT